MSDLVINPVWASYCARRIDGWIDWLNNIQIDSYIELSERFIALNPHYIPTAADRGSSSGQTFERLMIDDEFIASLSDAGLLVWANSGVADFVLAIGDDRSDEDMFVAVDAHKQQPLYAGACVYTSTIGQKPSKAPAYLDDTEDVIDLLQTLAQYNVCHRH